MGGNIISPDPGMMAFHPHAYDPMGITAEAVAEKYHISRAEQDAFAVQSHQRAKIAQEKGLFAEEIIPVSATAIGEDEKGETITEKIIFDQDEGIRPDSTIESLSTLRPNFKANGTVTAGNSSQTSDGAAFAVLMSIDQAKEFGYVPLAKLIGFSVIGVAPEIMGIGPIMAIPKVLRQTNLSLNDIDLIELNEAFASQSLACIHELNLDVNKVNVNGGAIAMGHPLGCTGTALTVKLIYELQRRKKKRGIVSMCIGSGMGAAGVFEMI
jgi:acetyl-CoA acyltransferase